MRNPIAIGEKKHLEKGKSFQTRQGKSVCVFAQSKIVDPQIVNQ